jgi:hypothetical protein
MDREGLIDIGLVGLTTLGALWLDSHKRAEPDWTWVEVCIGTAVCLAAAGLRSRVRGGTWRDHEREVWRAFLLGGAPVIAGEISQALAAWAERDAYTAGRYQP